MESNKDKNVNKLVALVEKQKMSNLEIDNVIERLLAMKTAA